MIGQSIFLHASAKGTPVAANATERNLKTPVAASFAYCNSLLRLSSERHMITSKAMRNALRSVVMLAA